jgi:pyruvate dehydrogenase E1 component beta subunit
MSMSGGQFSVPIVFRGPTGNAGMLSSQHSQCFENWYANCPGLKVVVPSNPADAKGLLKSSIIDPDPVIFMESELMYGDKGEVPEETYYIPLGKANVTKQGTDVTLVGFGKIMKVVNAAAAELEKEGIHAEVIDLRTVRPIDYETVIGSVKSWPLGSIATEVAFKVQKDAFDYLDAPVLRIMGGDVPLPYAPTLIQEYLPNPERVIKAVKEVMYVAK